MIYLSKLWYKERGGGWGMENYDERNYDGGFGDVFEKNKREGERLLPESSMSILMVYNWIIMLLSTVNKLL